MRRFLALDARLPAFLVLVATRLFVGDAFAAENHKYFVTPAKAPIDWVCVIPSYAKISGVGIGPDGKGRSGSKENYLLKPFRYTSSENFTGKLLSGGGIIIPIPPFVALGESYYNEQLLVLRPGYQPLPIEGMYHHRTETLTMKPDTTKQTEAVINDLLKRDARSSLLFRYFVLATGRDAGELVIDYTTDDDALLRACLQAPSGSD